MATHKGHKVSAMQNMLAFLAHISLVKMRLHVMLKQIKLYILILILGQIYLIKEKSCHFTYCVKKL